jgi:hypothetical protein
VRSTVRSPTDAVKVEKQRERELVAGAPGYSGGFVARWNIASNMLRASDESEE